MEAKQLQALQECIEAHHHRDTYRGVKEALPQLVYREHRARDNKEDKHMEEAHIALHTLKVAPETLKRVSRKHGSYCHPRDKRNDGPHNPAGARAILRVADCEYKVQRSDNLHDNAEDKVLARNVGKEEIRHHRAVGDDKRYKKGKEQSADNPPAQVRRVIHNEVILPHPPPPGKRICH